MKHPQSSLQIIFLTAILIYNAASAASAPQKVPTFKQEIADIVVESAFDENGYTPLREAVSRNNLKAVQYFIKTDPEDIHKPCKRNQYPLWHATHKGSIPIVKALVENKANINQGNFDVHETSLMRAAYLHNAEMAQYLIQANANIHAERTNGDSVLDFAFFDYPNRVNNPHIIDILTAAGAQNKAPRPTIQHAIHHHHHSVLSLLISLGADINALINCDGHNYTPLEYSFCIDSINTDAAKMLIDAGADVNKTGDKFSGFGPISSLTGFTINNYWELNEQTAYLAILQDVLRSPKIDWSLNINKRALNDVLERHCVPVTRMLMHANAPLIARNDSERTYLDRIKIGMESDRKRKQIAVQFLCEQTGSEHNAKNIGNIVGEYLGVSKT